MNNISIEFWLQLGVYLVTISVFTGSLMNRIKALEKKQESHNEFMKRVAKLETYDHTRLYRIKNIKSSIKKIEMTMDEIKKQGRRY